MTIKPVLFQPGDRVVEMRGLLPMRTGTVKRAGDCGYPACPWRERCVTVYFDGSFTYENRPAERLALVGP